VVPAVYLMLLFAMLAAGAGGGSVWTVGLLLLLLAVSLLIHELAHALVARALGLRVLDITIWPLGGMARMEGLTLHPGREAPVAAAGPLANLILAGLCVLLPGPLGDAAVWMNLVLGLGNLIPAFPLDGGRLLRAWFAAHNPMVDATAAAVRVGRWLALALLLLACYQGSILFGILIGIYLWWSGARELLQVMLQEGAMPQRTLGEVLRHCYPGRRPVGDAHTPEEADASPEAPPLDHELEQFHGSLDEYFRDRPPS